MDYLEALRTHIVEGSWRQMPDLTRQALEAGLAPHSILSAITAAMDKVGEEWRVGNMFIPEVLVSAQTLQASMEVLKPHLSASERTNRGKVIIGTVQGDFHDIGKSLVAMMLEGAGYVVTDLGVDVPPLKFVEAIREQSPDIVGLSALLTTALSFMRDTIRTIEEAGLRSRVKIIVGGAPITRPFADSIGADGYAPDGASAADEVRRLLGVKD